ncbi:MAG: hypothetical protein ACI4GZ_05570 [Ruminococcus sp.]
MTKDIKIPFNDVFFYGVNLNSRESTDVRNDIFANILMRYLRTLRPVSNRLYRATDTEKLEYTYSFVPSRPLSWRVIRNRIIVEEIEQLSDGKYCLNLYDSQGREVKCVHFSPQHRWLKTNYFNTVYGDNLLCSIVPKELNGETAILLYTTGETYSKTLFCCPRPSCADVEQSLFARVPLPEVTALTNYGILYFASEETLNIYTQVLSEEEKKYAELNKAPVYTTDEDIASGFCFSKDSFDTSQNNNVFSISEAAELDDSGLSESERLSGAASDAPELNESLENCAPATVIASSPYSLDDDISAIIKYISDTVDIHIDENKITDLSDAEEPRSLTGLSYAEATQPRASDGVSVKEEPVSDGEEYAVPVGDGIAEELKTAAENTESAHLTAETPEAQSSPESKEDIDLLSALDEDIDDYVKKLIDSLLENADNTADWYHPKSNADFAPNESSSSEDIPPEAVNSAKSYIEKTSADCVIESGGSKYYYFGETDKEGKRCGMGKTLTEDGTVAYNGEYRNDKRNGKGSFYYKDGSLCYFGQWYDNERNGFGLGINSETGISNVGMWKNNKPTGIGVRFDSEGRFLYIDSACHKPNGGIRITDFTENSLTVEYWDSKSFKTIKREITLGE